MNFDRRSFLKAGAASLASMSMPGMAAGNNLPHFAPKAKSVIFLHMVGAPSQLDLFDYKPELEKWDGKDAPEELYKGKKFAFITGVPKMMGSPYKFKKHGESGQYMSELLPHMSKCVDDMAFIRSVHTKEFNHAPAQLAFQTGLNRQGNPSMGSWLSYGLGSNNKNLPPFVVMVSGVMPGAGSQLWNNGFLPSVHQGVEFRSKGDPVLYLSDPKGMSRQHRRDIVSDINALNRESYRKSRDAEVQTRISQYNLAYRMQDSVPELTDGKYLRNLPNAPHDLHGFVIKKEGDEEFLYGSLMNAQEVIKMTLEGKAVLKISGSLIPEKFKHPMKKILKLTSVDVGPNGDIYTVDGYGMDYIHRFDKKGNYKESFAGRKAPYNFANCHKIFIDPRFTPARILCCDRKMVVLFICH